MFVLTPMIMSPFEDLWPWFIIMALVAVVPAIFVGPAWQRILGITFLLVALGLLAMSIKEGKAREERRQRFRAQQQNARAIYGRTNQTNQPQRP